MAALNMPNGTWLGSTTVTVFEFSDTVREPKGATITSGAASAAGASTLAHAGLLPGGVPYLARGLGPDNVLKTVTVFAS
jgi:hypothetical protein